MVKLIFMENESSTGKSSIDEIVQQHAASNQENNNAANQENGNNGNDNSGNGSSDEGDAQNQGAGSGDKGQGAEGGVETELQKLLKELEVDSVDALKEKLKKPAADLTPEQKEKAEALYKLDLKKFAVENGVMKDEDFVQLDTLKAKQDADVVFEKFKEQYKAENPDVSDEDLEQEAKDEFEEEYKLNSKNEKTKERGVSRLAKEAAEIRQPLESSFNSVKERFDNETQLKQIVPKFTEKIGLISNELVPEKKEWFVGKDGEESVPIEVEISPEDRKEIADKVSKRLQTSDIFNLYREGKVDEIKTIATDYADYLVGQKVRDAGNAKIAEIFLGRGAAKGSTIGAKNSFAVNQAIQTAHEKEKKSTAENEQAVLSQFGQSKT